MLTAEALAAELLKLDADTPVIAQTCCFENAAAGGIQLATVRIYDDGSIVPVPEGEHNAVAVEIINVDA